MSTSDPQNPGSGDKPPAGQPRQHVSARVPDHVRNGVFSSGVLVMTGGSEFILDFIQNLGQPAQVAARVVMPYTTVPQFIEALRTNLDIYKKRFGEPPELPRPPQPPRKPSVQEIYDDLKVSDEVLIGAYSNGVMIGHGASEFKFDFLANLVPHAAVSCRVYLSAPHVPRLLESLSKTYTDWQQRVQQQQQQQRQQQQEQQDPPPDEDKPPEPEQQ